MFCASFPSRYCLLSLFSPVLLYFCTFFLCSFLCFYPFFVHVLALSYFLIHTFLYSYPFIFLQFPALSALSLSLTYTYLDSHPFFFYSLRIIIPFSHTSLCLHYYYGLVSPQEVCESVSCVSPHRISISLAGPALEGTHCGGENVGWRKRLFLAFFCTVSVCFSYYFFFRMSYFVAFCFFFLFVIMPVSFFISE